MSVLTADEILALVEQGRLEDARAAYEEALPRGRDDLDLVADAADFFLNRGQLEDGDRESMARGLDLARTARKLARKQGAPDVELEMQVLEATALNQLGASQEALARLDQVLADEPDHPVALVERGFALFELCRLEEARDTLERAVTLDPRAAAAHQTLGLIAERAGDAEEARRWFEKARSIAPVDFPEPVHLSPAAFDQAVEDALVALPDSVRRWLSNVAITVDELPSDDDLRGSEPPLSPAILGLFRGSPLGDKASMDPWSHFPSSIALYQRNLERFARDHDDLIEQIGITLVHEVGHFLGLDEDELWERGLD